MVFAIILFIILAVNFKFSSGCDRTEFLCSNGQCIEKLLWCDGEIDCLDQTDELFCGTDGLTRNSNCGANPAYFKCHDGMCIPIEGLCDGLSSCRDKSDENNCVKDLRESKSSPKQETVDYSKLLVRPSIGNSSSFTKLNYEGFRSQLESARQWLFSQQDEKYGWGDKTARVVIALYLSKIEKVPKTEQEMLMDKQLDIDISVALARNKTKRLSNNELALYINALTAACSNPKNFYGYDLVSILRQRTDGALIAKQFVSPYVLLTLCINNYTTLDDYNYLQKLVGLSKNIDSLAISVLASTCILNVPAYYNIHSQAIIVSHLLEKIETNGLPGNIYEMALLVQALNEAKVDLHRWSRRDSIDFILSKQNEAGSFGDILATYYVLPVLSGRSMLSLSKHCIEDSNDVTPLSDLKNTQQKNINVIYSLRFGYPVEMSQKMMLQVTEGTNFFDIMRLAQAVDKNYRFSLDDSKSIPFVYSIGGSPIDAERGLYWALYFSNNSTDISYNKDIRRLIPRDGEEITFWLKPL